MRHFAAVFLCVLGLASAFKTEEQRAPEGAFDSEWISLAGQFEGDMKLTESQLRQLNDSSSERNALINENALWTDGKIPYVIDSVFSSNEVATIEAAFATYASTTCLRMVKRTTESDYVSIIKDGGCWSYVGKTGGKQEVSLANGCVYEYIIIHEFMHASGFLHEQSRTDRDTYVRIAFENIEDGRENNFNSYSASQIQTLGEPYDYSSVMHYGAYDFSKNGQKTIERLDGSNDELGNNVGFSEVDANKLNKLYKCDATVTTTTAPTVATTDPTAVTTTTAPTVATTDPTAVTTSGPTTTTGTCSDAFSFCRRLRRFCDDYPEEMAIACRETCEICVNCVDKKEKCAKWASRGKCETKVKMMTRNCKASCGFC